MSRQLIIDFDTKIRDWDGFGFNYVQSAQARDIVSHPQEYGGFSLLSLYPPNMSVARFSQIVSFGMVFFWYCGCPGGFWGFKVFAKGFVFSSSFTFY